MCIELGIQKQKYYDRNLSAEERANDLLSCMTLDEKTDQLRSQMIMPSDNTFRDGKVGHVNTPAFFSYTEFKYDNLKISTENISDKVIINVYVDVENVGFCEGDEVVQLYLHDELSSVARPLRELKDFQRISLKPTENIQVLFTLLYEDLALWDKEMKFIVEPGWFRVMIGSSSKDIRLEGRFEIKGFK